MNEQQSITSQAPDGKWSPSIPEPFWFRRWFRWVPGCYWCSMATGSKVIFADRDEWVRHYRQEHADE